MGKEAATWKMSTFTLKHPSVNFREIFNSAIFSLFFFNMRIPITQIFMIIRVPIPYSLRRYTINQGWPSLFYGIKINYPGNDRTVKVV